MCVRELRYSIQEEVIRRSFYPAEIFLIVNFVSLIIITIFVIKISIRYTVILLYINDLTKYYKEHNIINLFLLLYLELFGQVGSTSIHSIACWFSWNEKYKQLKRYYRVKLYELELEREREHHRNNATNHVKNIIYHTVRIYCNQLIILFNIHIILYLIYK